MDQLFLKRSWAEIDLEQIKLNYEAYMREQPSDAKVIAVVKADAYGHDAVPVSKMLMSLGVDFFAVSNLNEAIQLREGGIAGEILILGYTPPQCAEFICKYDLIQTLICEEHAAEMAKTGYRMKCQFAIDTGMNRVGLPAKDLAYCEKVIRAYTEFFDLNGMFTHLCVADRGDFESIEFTEHQISTFTILADKLHDLHMPYVHCLNSAGGFYYKWHNSLRKYIRLGIMLYGLKPDAKSALPHEMQGALSWKSLVSMVKVVRCGESIGYGRSYTATKDILVATIPTGYADGYPRTLSNNGYVLLKGQRAAIVGKVCMDQMMVDVTHIPNVKAGDIVTLIGVDQDERMSADDIAAMIGTIGYEIICGLSPRVNRTYR